MGSNVHPPPIPMRAGGESGEQSHRGHPDRSRHRSDGLSGFYSLVTLPRLSSEFFRPAGLPSFGVLIGDSLSLLGGGGHLIRDGPLQRTPANCRCPERRETPLAFEQPAPSHWSPHATKYGVHGRCFVAGKQFVTLPSYSLFVVLAVCRIVR